MPAKPVLPEKAPGQKDSPAVIIKEKPIDNPGGGDCAFYAFAIGLIDIIQEENYYLCTTMFDRWKALDPSTSALFDEIKVCDLTTGRVQKSQMLVKLQQSLRKISFEAQLTELKAAAADSKGCRARIIHVNPGYTFDKTKVMSSEEILVIVIDDTYWLGFKNKKGEYEQKEIHDESMEKDLKHYQHNQTVTNAELIVTIDMYLISFESDGLTRQAYKNLIGNSQYGLFSGLYHGTFIPRDAVAFAQFPAINEAIEALQKKIKQKAVDEKRELTFDEEQLALVHAFLTLIYGQQTPFESVTAETAPMINSPIVDAMKLMTKDCFWGTHLDLDYLAPAFKVNFHYLVNSHPIQEFVDKPNQPVITANNLDNVHWTTHVKMAKSGGDKLLIGVPKVSMADSSDEDEDDDELEVTLAAPLGSVTVEEPTDPPVGPPNNKLKEIIARLQKEFLREVQRFPLNKEKKVIRNTLQDNTTATDDFITQANGLKKSLERSLLSDSLTTILICITVLNNAQITPNPAIDAQLDGLSNQLTNIENAPPFYKQWHQFVSLVKQFVELCGITLCKNWASDTAYRGPIRNQFWSESEEINNLTKTHRQVVSSN